MKTSRGFISFGTLLPILILAAAVYFVFSLKSHPEWKEKLSIFSPVTEEASAPCASGDAPSIAITNPYAGASYSVGEKVSIKWKACNVSDFSLALLSGGKEFGQIYEYYNLDIDQSPAQRGSYSWTATNPAEGFTGVSTNSYQIGAASISPDIIVRSGTFTVGR